MSVRVDIDVDDFMGECDSCDIKEIIDWLVDNDHLSKDGLILEASRNMTFQESELLQNLKLIREKYYQLSIDQLEAIKQIAQ